MTTNINTNRQHETIELEGEDDSLLEEDLEVHRRPQRDYHLRKIFNFSVFWWISNIAMGIAIAWLAFQLDAKRNLLSRFELAGDVNRIWPRLAHRGITFRPDNRYAANLTSSAFKQSTRELWLDLVPKGLGLIEVPNPGNHPRLPSPYVKDDKTVYATSVTQQLHCLYLIMNAVNDLSVNQGSFDTSQEGEKTEAQLSYCFDYLRQVIMCHGDTALEGARTSSDVGLNGINGLNVRHVCKPWQRIYDRLDNHRIDDSVWQ